MLCVLIRRVEVMRSLKNLRLQYDTDEHEMHVKSVKVTTRLNIDFLCHVDNMNKCLYKAHGCNLKTTE